MPPATPSSSAPERRALLRRVTAVLETPMMILGLVWLALLVVELVVRPHPWVEAAGTAIWAVFVVEFGLELIISPKKLTFLRQNWLIALSLVLPAFRVLRIARVLRFAQVARTGQVVRGLAGAHRGVRSLHRAVRRRGLAYVLGITTVVAFAGAAGMLACERGDTRPGGFTDYSSSLWFTLMLLTSIGSEYWPRSTAGRALCLLLSVYGFAIFGYITAALASFFVDRDADENDRGGGDAALREVRAELAALRAELAQCGAILRPGTPRGTPAAGSPVDHADAKSSPA